MHAIPQIIEVAENTNIGNGSSISPISGARTATSLLIRLQEANTKDIYLAENYQIIYKYPRWCTVATPSLANHKIVIAMCYLDMLLFM